MRSAMITALCAGFIATLAGAGNTAEPWKIDANANLTTTLNTYSDSWVGGEAGSFTWGSQFLGTAERQLSKVMNTKATLKLQFGQTKIQNKDNKIWSAPEKSTDLIDAEELFRFTLGLWVDPFASVRGISQFLDGSDTGLIRYLNPWDVTEAAGVSRTLRKNDYIDWSTRLGAAARQLIDRDKYDAVSGSRETDITNDGGFEFNMDLKATSREKWWTLLSALRVYEALVSSKEDSAGHWRYPHMKWENTLTLAFAKYLMHNMSAYAYYDRDISYKVRLKETFSAGLTYIYSKK
jgi:hypothetical protein